MNTAQILIIIHASLGGIALLFGTLALIIKKGGTNHKLSGKVFFYSMLTSAITAMVIAFLPDHSNLFLFTIGVFSTYFLLTGYLALRYKKQGPDLKADYFISILMILTGFAMVLYPLIAFQKFNIILTAFGCTGLIFAIRDLLLYRKPTKLKSSWLKLHLSKMLAGYIAAVTAFVVVNKVLHPLIGWLGPGLIGGFYIAYWIRKVDKSTSKDQHSQS